MKCPICLTENPPGAKTCSACGSNLKTRGGADIVMRDDGTVDHAGNSRWKSGAGMAGGGLLLGLGKMGALSLLFKAYWIYALLRLASAGGTATIIGIGAILALVIGTIFRFRRRLPA